MPYRVMNGPRDADAQVRGPLSSEFQRTFDRRENAERAAEGGQSRPVFRPKGEMSFRSRRFENFFPRKKLLLQKMSTTHPKYPTRLNHPCLGSVTRRQTPEIKRSGKKTICQINFSIYIKIYGRPTKDHVQLQLEGIYDNRRSRQI